MWKYSPLLLMLSLIRSGAQETLKRQARTVWFVRFDLRLRAVLHKRCKKQFWESNRVCTQKRISFLCLVQLSQVYFFTKTDPCPYLSSHSKQLLLCWPNQATTLPLLRKRAEQSNLKVKWTTLSSLLWFVSLLFWNDDNSRGNLALLWHSAHKVQLNIYPIHGCDKKSWIAHWGSVQTEKHGHFSSLSVITKSLTSLVYTCLTTHFLFATIIWSKPKGTWITHLCNFEEIYLPDFPWQRSILPNR